MWLSPSSVGPSKIRLEIPKRMELTSQSVLEVAS